MASTQAAHPSARGGAATHLLLVKRYLPQVWFNFSDHQIHNPTWNVVEFFKGMEKADVSQYRENTRFHELTHRAVGKGRSKLLCSIIPPKSRSRFIVGYPGDTGLGKMRETLGLI